MKQEIRGMRADGWSIRQIVSALGVSAGAVCHHIYGKRKRSAPQKDVVTRRVLVLGSMGSGSCYDAFISLPRVSILENAHVA